MDITSGSSRYFLDDEHGKCFGCNGSEKYDLASNGAWPHNDMIEFLLSFAHTARRALKSGN